MLTSRSAAYRSWPALDRLAGVAGRPAGAAIPLMPGPVRMTLVSAGCISAAVWVFVRFTRSFLLFLGCIVAMRFVADVTVSHGLRR